MSRRTPSPVAAGVSPWPPAPRQPLGAARVSAWTRSPPDPLKMQRRIAMPTVRARAHALFTRQGVKLITAHTMKGRASPLGLETRVIPAVVIHP